MNTRHLLSFFCGAVVVMLGFSALSTSNPSHHVYELRMYHVHEGKMDALKARFGDHTDALFKRHNMKSIGYWVPEDGGQNLFVTFWSIRAASKRRKIGTRSMMIRNGRK